MTTQHIDEIVTRFAPSPTGALHLGHGFSAMLGWALAQGTGGRWRARIEDSDTLRCRPEHAAGILEDLHWLGLHPDGPVWRQSERLPDYAAALEHLRGLGVIYPCICTRADIAAAGNAPHGPEGLLYPGTCRGRDEATGDAAWRLDAVQAAALAGPLWFEDAGAGRVAVDPSLLGDFVVARRDAGVAYHLAVVVDDAAQGITDVVRGDDLLPACHGQRLLQALLGLPGPRYHHHPLLLGPAGKRLAKRDEAVTLADRRAADASPHALVAAWTPMLAAALRQSARMWPRFAMAAAAFQG
ncbi:tRNA glutamyl-Q(34) synthetase GluQRS [Polymorphobacter multimanifer]|uniref:tRNA glutamyl-Q(34) synthetase GluQRS n=1 Tax=Polymorphobacter multimanifer TaxID=1070431 RepID=UPI00166DE6D0|nr:tRNA glutamyl-Q(34) synthetase GluQRS [Polymorphobacter multimanifer]